MCQRVTLSGDVPTPEPQHRATNGDTRPPLRGRSGDAASAPRPTKWKAPERSRNVGRQRGAPLRDDGGRARPPSRQKPQTETRDLPSEGGVATRAQHRGRPSGRPRSAAGMRGGNEELRSEMTGGGPDPQADKSHKRRHATSPPREEWRRGLSTASSDKRERSAAGMWGGNEELRSEMTGGGPDPQADKSHKRRHATSPPREEWRRGLSTASSDKRERSAAGLWG